MKHMSKVCHFPTQYKECVDKVALKQARVKNKWVVQRGHALATSLLQKHMVISSARPLYPPHISITRPQLFASRFALLSRDTEFLFLRNPAIEWARCKPPPPTPLPSSFYSSSLHPPRLHDVTAHSRKWLVSLLGLKGGVGRGGGAGGGREGKKKWRILSHEVRWHQKFACKLWRVVDWFNAAELKFVTARSRGATREEGSVRAREGERERELVSFSLKVDHTLVFLGGGDRKWLG